MTVPISESTLDLINREIDGETTAEESARLEAILASDPAARETYDSLQEVFDALALIADDDPPATLASEIISELRARTGSTPLPAPDQPSAPPAVLLFSGHKPSPPTTKERPMNKKTGILAGFAAVAALLVVFFFVWPPEAKDNEAASGAIGAVQKHRAPQITANDVILGDEPSRQEESAVYAGFLGDASKLSNISAQLASQELASKIASNRAVAVKELEAIEASLASQEAALAQRILANADQVLSAAHQVLEVRKNDVESRQLAAMEANVESLQAMSKKMATEQLANKRLQSFVQELNSLTRQLADRGLLVRFENAQESLASAEQQLASKSLQAQAMESATKRLQSAEQELQAVSSMENRVLASRKPYLEALATEHQDVEMAHRKLSSFNESLAAQEQVESTALQNVSELLAAQAAQLESRALKSMESRMESRRLQAQSLASMGEMLQAIGRSLSSLQAQEALNARKQLSSMEQTLNAQEAQLQQRRLGQMQAELGAIESYMASHEQLQAQFANRVRSSEQLQVQSLANFQEHLAAVSRDLDNRSKLQSQELASVSEALAVQAHQLESRTRLGKSE